MTLHCPGASWFRLWRELVERVGRWERVGEARWSSGSELVLEGVDLFPQTGSLSIIERQ